MELACTNATWFITNTKLPFSQSSRVSTFTWSRLNKKRDKPITDANPKDTPAMELEEHESLRVEVN